MSENQVQKSTQTPGLALASMYLGIGSLVAFLASILFGFLVESIGIVDFFGVVFALAAAAIVCGIIARNKIAAEKRSGKRTAMIGLILGGIALFLTFVTRVAIFLFFIPWLGA